MNVRLIQVDGKLPNLALMQLAHWHRSRGDNVLLTRQIYPEIFEPSYDRIYASCIFSFSDKRLARVVAEWPDVVVGGTGSGRLETVESVIGGDWPHVDYADYPDYQFSLGFTQRGCRMKCKFCVVPQKEGANRSNQTVAEIWRGDPYPRKLHLLDNDFFGQPDWRARVDEIREGGFKVCLNQGINVRLIDDEAAEALASIEYRDDQFQSRRIYMAWDNFKDEGVFFRGIDTLERHGIPPTHVMAYMLVGYDPKETWDRIFHRFDKMVERGIKPYPMVYNNESRALKRFQRWVVTGLYRAVPFADYDANAKGTQAARNFQSEMFDGAAV